MEHLLIFSYDYPPANGGIARLCQEIVDGMSARYASVTVLTRKKKGLSRPYNHGGEKVVALPSWRVLCEVCAIFYLLTLQNRKTTDVLCGLWHPEAALCLLAGLKRVHVLAHGTELLAGSSRFRKKLWLPGYARVILKRVSNVIANSRYTRSLALEVAPRAAVTALPPGVNLDFFRPMQQPKDSATLKLCTVSRVLPFKGHDLIAGAIAALPDDIRPHIRWSIGGTGDGLPELEALVKTLGIGELTRFEGFIPDNKLPGFYNSHDCFILCTRQDPASAEVEGFGLVFLEAQACGVPVIGTHTGGIPDAVEYDNGGWLIKQDDLEGLVKQLTQLFRHRDLLEVQSKKARLRVEKNGSRDLYCRQLHKILRS